VCIYNKIAEAIKNTKSFFHLVRLSTSTAKPLRRGRLQSHVLHLQRPGRGLPAKNHVTSGYATTPALTGRDNHGTENETKIRAVAKRRAPCAVQAKHRQPIRPGLEHGIGSGRRAQRKLPCTGGTGGTRAAGLVTEEKKKAFAFLFSMPMQQRGVCLDPLQIKQEIPLPTHKHNL
jgi:hypothetical protein